MRVFGSLDEAVECLKDPDGDPIIESVEDAFPVMPDGVCRQDNRFKMTVGSPEETEFQEGLLIFATRLIRVLSKGRKDLIGPGYLQVVGRQGYHLSTLPGSQIIWAHERQIARLI